MSLIHVLLRLMANYMFVKECVKSILLETYTTELIKTDVLS